MTTLLSLTFNAGTNGAAITTATETSLSFAQGTLTYDNTHAIGAEAAKCDTGTGGSGTFCSLRKDFTAVADLSLSSNFWIGALPAASVTLSILTTGTVTGCAMRMNTLGQILLVDGASTVDTSALTVTPGARVSYEWNASSTHGAQELRLFIGADIGGATPTEVLSGTYTAATTFTRHQVGALGTPPVNFQVWYDSITVTDVYVPPYVPPVTDTLFDEDFEAGAAGAPVVTTDFSAQFGSWTYDNANTVGLLSATTTTGTTAFFTETLLTSVVDTSIYFNIWLDTLPATTFTIASVMTGTTTLAALRIKSDGTVIMVNGQPGLGGVQVAGTLLSVTANQRIQGEWHVNSSTSLQEFRLFLTTDINGTAPSEYIAGAYTGGTIGQIRLGVISAPTNVLSMWMDSLSATDLYVPPYVPPILSTLLSTQTFEGGADGVALTGLNTDFDTFVGAGTRAFSTAQHKGGTRSALIDSGASSAVTSFAKSFTAVTSSNIFIRLYRYVPAIPATNTTTSRCNFGGAGVCAIRYNAAGTISLMNGTGVAGTSTITPPVGSWARLDWSVRLGTSQQTLSIFTGGNVEGITPNNTIVGAVAGASVDAVAFGTVFGAPANWRIYFDDIAISTASMPPPTGTPGSTTSLRYLKAGVWTPLTVHKL